MSCIPKLLDLKGDSEFLRLDDITVLESGGCYKNYHHCVTFRKHGFRCAYVAILKTNKYWHAMDIHSDLLYELNAHAHGGITYCGPPMEMVQSTTGHFCEDKWLGFDAGHCWDGIDFDAKIKYFEENKKKYGSLGDWGDPIRTNEYMTRECERLIDQIQTRNNDAI